MARSGADLGPADPVAGTPGGRSRHVSEHLANERTYLAWLRTAITLMTFGLALNRFAVELGALRRLAGVLRRPSLSLEAEHVGVGMIATGMTLMLAAAIRYAQVRRSIDDGIYRPLSRAVWIIAALVLAGGVTCLVWVLD